MPHSRGIIFGKFRGRNKIPASLGPVPARNRSVFFLQTSLPELRA